MWLPKLASLRAFEVAARHLSFTRAAAELDVLPPAVSRQVAELEVQLGTPLFTRSKPRLTLTSEGQRLQSSVSAAFLDISRAVDSIRVHAGSDLLRVNVSIGIASCWLMARLGDFRAKHPDIDLQLVTRDSNRDFAPDESDIVVLFGEDDLRGTRVEKIFSEELIAVGSPGLNLGVESPADLLHAPLLRLSSHEFADDWELWFASASLRHPPAEPSLAFNSFIVYLQAALNGEGVALSWRTLTDDLIDAGRLRQITDHSVTTDRGYFCCVQEHARDNPSAHVFVDWLISL